jgi:hypothetical protein
VASKPNVNVEALRADSIVRGHHASGAEHYGAFVPMHSSPTCSPAMVCAPDADASRTLQLAVERGELSAEHPLSEINWHCRIVASRTSANNQYLTLLHSLSMKLLSIRRPLPSMLMATPAFSSTPLLVHGLIRSGFVGSTPIQ